MSQDSDRETVRRQYINLVKKYHPDTARNGEDNIEKFHLIDKAYKELQKFFAEKDRDDRECEVEYGLYYQVRKALESIIVIASVGKNGIGSKTNIKYLSNVRRRPTLKRWKCMKRTVPEIIQIQIENIPLPNIDNIFQMTAMDLVLHIKGT